MLPVKTQIVFLFILIYQFVYAQNNTFSNVDSLNKDDDIHPYQKELYAIIYSNKDVKKDTTDLLIAHFKLINHFEYTLPNDDSIQFYYSRAKELTHAYKDQMYIAQLSMLWGNHLINKSDFVSALNVFQSLETEVDENNYPFSTVYYSHYGRLFYSLKEYENAIKQIRKVIRIYKQDKNYKRLSNAYNNLGINYRNLNEIDSSIYYHQKSLNINIELNDTSKIIRSYGNIGGTYKHNNDIDNAGLYYKKAYQISPEKASSALLRNYSTYLIIKEDYNKANSLLLRAKNIAFDHRLKLDILTDLVLLKKTTQNYKEALVYQSELDSLQRLLLDETRIKEIERLKISHETAKKEERIKVLEDKNTLQNTIIRKNKKLVIIVSFSFFLIIIILILYLKNKSKNERIERMILQQNVLRMKMNPHFIFNALSSIQTNILKKENERAVKYLSKFSKLLRYNLEYSEEDSILLSKEIQSIKDYLELQQIRLNGNLKYRIKMDSTIEPDMTYIPFMMLQPLVENFIEHGISYSYIDCPSIHLDFSDNEQYLECIIKDNGVGYSNTHEKRDTTKKSISTKVIKERLNILSKKQGIETKFTIEDIIDKDKHIKGTKITITLPITNN